MAGTWEVEFTLHPPGATPRTTTIEIEAATGALDQDRSRRIEWAAMTVSPLGLLSCLLGGLLSGLAVVTLWASRRGRMPAWATPLGSMLLAAGGFLVLRVVLVDAYPTTYLPNPLAATPEVMAQGRALFLEHCTACHGDAGQGDGPVATTLDARPADLTAAHVDDHTDGDLFWWLTHGMPGTAMPAWEERLVEPARWTLIRYIRSLRQGKT
jgi:mono/diheme cytochrome c family protein